MKIFQLTLKRARDRFHDQVQEHAISLHKEGLQSVTLSCGNSACVTRIVCDVTYILSLVRNAIALKTSESTNATVTRTGVILYALHKPSLRSVCHSRLCAECVLSILEHDAAKPLKFSLCN